MRSSTEDFLLVNSLISSINLSISFCSDLNFTSFSSSLTSGVLCALFSLTSISFSRLSNRNYFSSAIYSENLLMSSLIVLFLVSNSFCNSKFSISRLVNSKTTLVSSSDSCWDLYSKSLNENSLVSFLLSVCLRSWS